MAFFARLVARFKAQRAQEAASRMALKKSFEEMQSSLRQMTSYFGSPEERGTNERIEGTKRAAQAVNEQAFDFEQYTLEYRAAFFPGQNLLQMAIGRKKMTPGRLHAAEYEWLPRAVRGAAGNNFERPCQMYGKGLPAHRCLGSALGWFHKSEVG